MKILTLSLVLILISSCSNVIMPKGAKLRDNEHGKPGVCTSVLEKDFTKDDLKNDFGKVTVVNLKDPSEKNHVDVRFFQKHYMECENQ